ncbi:MAG: hypothetical protein HOM21_05775 [Halobacteriovoraceae bacterium]|jgi:hypothetical protein|nr:hypothetical protein [Halobacteriovoraceae bacterium]
MGFYKSFYSSSFIVLLLFLSVTAEAGLLVDPYVGYSLNGSGDSKFNFDSSATGNWETDYSALGYGLRLGWKNPLGLMIGAEYSAQAAHEVEGKLAANQTFTFNGNSITSYKFDAKKTHMGIFAGFALPMFRLWGTYFLKSEMEVDKISGDEILQKGNTFEGSGYSLALGYTGLPFVGINFEFRNFKWDPERPASGHNYTAEFEASEYFLSVSLPLNF